MTSIKEKVNDILENSDFNDLPFEERKRIDKYMLERQISILYMTLMRFPELTNETWKKKQRDWLESSVEFYRKEYTDYE